ncbi:hypothetical protein [Nocardioides flavescens]|uniref:Uncharacterized protein n=1 Tax=Nocardioides flavescens TaxID=2691959 RepID=A0A6L7F2M6_9ACTN|nr:hypothetical protein [Nocardioides flavescens]MXG91681.1 hypothetical protein [Nocardioides flavescens]
MSAAASSPRAMSHPSSFVRQPLATALAAALLALGVTGAAWATSSATPDRAPQTQSAR